MKAPYNLDPIKVVFSPKEDPIAKSFLGPSIVGVGKPTGAISNAPTYSDLETTSRILAHRKVQDVKIVEGCTLKLEWFEFVDREAKSVYWSEVLRRKAWQEPQKEK